jgi:hypothetical protein
MICPRCKALRPFVNISAGGTQYRCGGCEWTYTLSTQAPTGTTSAAITTPATTLALTVASGGASFVNGMYLLVDVGSSAEVVQVNGTPTGTSIPVPSGFAKTHSSGAAIGQALATPTFGGVGEDAVVGAPGWGF